MRIDEHLNLEGVVPWKLALIPRTVNGRVLDAGSGVSEPYRIYLEPFCPEYVSVDIRPGAMVQADLAALPYPDKHFAFVWCSEVLEHVDDPRRVAEELVRVGEHGCANWPGVRHPNFARDPGHREVDVSDFPVVGIITEREDGEFVWQW